MAMAEPTLSHFIRRPLRPPAAEAAAPAGAEAEEEVRRMVLEGLAGASAGIREDLGLGGIGR